jgi:hypothetical protein
MDATYKSFKSAIKASGRLLVSGTQLSMDRRTLASV